MLVDQICDLSDDEEALREQEALLYSQLHHDTSKGTEEQITPFMTPLPSKQPSPEPVTSPRVSTETVTPFDTIITISDEDSSESETDDDDVCQIIKAPVKTSVADHDVIDVPSDSEEDDDPGIVVLDSPEVVNNKDERAKEKVVEVRSQSPKLAISTATPRQKIAPYRVWSSDESDASESDNDSANDNQGSKLSLNVLGTRSDDVKFVSLPQTSEPCQKPSKWTKEMESFYNDVDYSLLNTSTEDLLDSMLAKCSEDRDANWEIDAEDYCGTSTPSRQRRYFRSQCSNCNSYGHRARECNRNQRKIICYMCCGENHSENQCPKAICLNCGASAKRYVSSCLSCHSQRDIQCHLCGLYGHNKARCRSRWRRFHSLSQDPVPALEVHRSSSENWCVNCGKQGHFLHKCPAYHYSPYPFQLLQTVDYQPIPDKPTTVKSRREQRRQFGANPTFLEPSGFDATQPPPAKRRRYSNKRSSEPWSHGFKSAFEMDRESSKRGKFRVKVLTSAKAKSPSGRNGRKSGPDRFGPVKKPWSAPHQHFKREHWHGFGGGSGKKTKTTARHDSFRKRGFRTAMAAY